MVLNCGIGEDSWESLGCKEIRSVNPKGNQSLILIGGTDAEAETPVLWPPGVKNWLIWKDPDAGKDWRWEEKGTTEDEIVGWQHLLNGHEFDQAPGDGEGQGSLACCSLWGHKESDTAEQLNWNEWLVRLLPVLSPSTLHTSSPGFLPLLHFTGSLLLLLTLDLWEACL